VITLRLLRRAGEGNQGRRPAAVRGSLPTVQPLLDHHADPDASNNDDLTAAAIAAYLKKPAVAALLRKAGGGE